MCICVYECIYSVCVLFAFPTFINTIYQTMIQDRQNLLRNASSQPFFYQITKNYIKSQQKQYFFINFTIYFR